MALVGRNDVHATVTTVGGAPVFHCHMNHLSE